MSRLSFQISCGKNFLFVYSVFLIKTSLLQVTQHKDINVAMDVLYQCVFYGADQSTP